MDADEKRKLANEKRLQAIKQWQKNQTVQNVRLISHAVKESRNDNLNKSSKLTLFNSDDEEEKYDNCFDIRPQFEGSKGQQLLEMSSQFSSRFKLDERFKEDEEQEKTEESNEKTKNLKILEAVIGYEVRRAVVDGKNMKKRQIRFDPEDESSSKYVKTFETSGEKPKKKKKVKKSQSCNDLTDVIPISSERYIEVTPNLKDILNSASSPFSLSQKFSCNDDPETSLADLQAIQFTEKKEKQHNFKTSNLKNTVSEKTNNTWFEVKVKNEPFFISKDDPRLKEGVEFFMRPKPLDELREEWNRRREEVLEMFRRKKKSTHRKPPKVQSQNSLKYKRK